MTQHQKNHNYEVFVMERKSDLNIILMSYDALNYFWEVLHVLFYEDEQDEEMKMDMTMFSKFCEHIKNTYSMFYHGGSSTDMIQMLKPFKMLVELSLYPELIDKNHTIIQELSEITVRAIMDLVCACSEENAIVVNDVRWYDFINDTPEDVWNRIKKAVR